MVQDIVTRVIHCWAVDVAAWTSEKLTNFAGGVPCEVHVHHE